MYFGGIFEFIYFKKYHIFYVNELLHSFIFYILLTKLKYHSNKFLKLILKMK